jgi:hypothetical protein
MGEAVACTDTYRHSSATARHCYPRVIAGKRACPPEDCGGPWGYENLLEALADPKHPDHDDLKEWVGGDFDPEHFEVPAG